MTLLKTESPFLFVTCQVGAEPALKKEMAHLLPGFHFAFSRPGFLTFKRSDGQWVLPTLSLSSVFARTYGVSLGKMAPSPEDVISLAQDLGKGDSVRLHFWERDLHVPGRAPMGYVPGELSEDSIQHLTRLKKSSVFSSSSIAEEGDLVLDVVVVDEKEWWIGYHIHSSAHSPFPGARPPIQVPAEAPSRAFLKLEEAILFGDIPVRSGDTAVEIGSAPGGACYSLLKRGLRVTGVDPGKMDPRVLAMPGFQHIERKIAAVLREELPESIQWLLLDMNVAPHVSLYVVDRLSTRMKDSLLGVLLTIKLNQWELADQIPDMLAHLQAMGMVRLRVKQLASSGREIFVYGLTRKGLLR